MNTASRRNRTRSGSVSSACDQSTEARNVCWRRTAVRAPPVSSRNRSCRLSRISSSDSARTRAAASSMASGMPSRRRQISVTTVGVVVGDGEIGPGTAGAVAEQLDRLVGQRQRRHPPVHLTRHAERLATRRQHRHARAGAQQVRRRAAALASSRCSQLSSTSSMWRSRTNRSSVSIVELAGLVGQAQRACHRDRHDVGMGDRRQVDIPDAVGEFVRHAGGDLDRQARLARAARAGQRDQPVVGERFP